MTTPVFVSMSDKKMASLITAAERRVAVAVPAIRPIAATALVTASRRIPSHSFAVVMDCDEEVFRLGYGDFSALETLREANVPGRQSSGLRIGVLVCDDEAWVGLLAEQQVACVNSDTDTHFGLLVAGIRKKLQNLRT